MKKLFSKQNRVNKGAPSGFVISLIFHGAIFFVAGLFVVFTVVNRAEPEFEAPPPIERPKMKLKKPKVKVRKSSNPKPSSRIVAKVKTKQMPEIQLPDLEGVGDGLMGGVGGGEFMDLPDIGELSAFGSEVSSGNDLVGQFYDLKRTHDGRDKPVEQDEVYQIFRKFLERGWDRSELAKYYKSRKKVYSNCICIGTVQSMHAPMAFGERTGGWAWCVLYSGKLVHPEDIKFRFRGVGDKFMAVRVDGQEVLITAYRTRDMDIYSDLWYAKDGQSRVYPMAENNQEVGDWIELKGGVPLDLEILVGDDTPGGLVYFQLAAEVEGEEYPRNPFMGGPTLPVFKTEMLTRAQLDLLYPFVYPGDICLTNDLVFSDIYHNPVSCNPPLKEVPPPVLLEDWIKEPRTWTSTDGKSIQGRYLLSSLDYVLVEQAGEQKKLPLDILSAADLRFLELVKPPQFKIEFSKTSRQIEESHLSHIDANVRKPRPASAFEYTFGAKVKKQSVGDYNLELSVEYFAIGKQVSDSSRYILLERKSDSFVPSRKNDFSLEFHGKPLRLEQYAFRQGSPMHGREPEGYLVVVTDEDDRVVQYETSHKFLFKNIGKLKQLPINAYFDKNCDRVFPARPTDADRGPGVYNP
jgi:hypothetical protein